VADNKKGETEDDDIRKTKKGKNNKKVNADGRSKKEEEAMEGRMTGFQYFNEKVGGVLNLEALEKAADEAAASGEGEDGEYDSEGVNMHELDEDLFDDEDDLDDLDFDSDDEEDDDDDDEEVDI